MYSLEKLFSSIFLPVLAGTIFYYLSSWSELFIFSLLLFPFLFTLFLRQWILYCNSKRRKIFQTKNPKVAVIGSGIAGTGAAWSLHQSNISATIYERNSQLGGNAKTHDWVLNENANDEEAEVVTTGLSVLAWPGKYFHTYQNLLQNLGIAMETVDLSYCIGEKKKLNSSPEELLDCVYAHHKSVINSEAKDEFQADLKAWSSLVAFVERINRIFQWSEVPSLYLNNPLNPLNFISLRLLTRFFGISNRFWNFIFVPIHSSTFLEIEMDSLPSVMAELLDAIIPINGDVPQLTTWKGASSRNVFQSMVQDFDAKNIRTSCEVTKVSFVERKEPMLSSSSSSSSSQTFDVFITDVYGDVERYDAVIFACSAVTMKTLLYPSNNNDNSDNNNSGNTSNNDKISNINNRNKSNNTQSFLLKNGLSNSNFLVNQSLLATLEKLLLTRTVYTEHRDSTFDQGLVHSHSQAVLPKHLESHILKHCCNYIEVSSENPKLIKNHFCISSWNPVVKDFYERQDPSVDEKNKMAMLVSYMNTSKEKCLSENKIKATVCNLESHPCLSTWHLFGVTQLWPLLQGTRDGQVYFCGSAVSVANGHDFSLLSGLVCASQLGARFPFESNSASFADFKRLYSLMFE